MEDKPAQIVDLFTAFNEDMKQRSVGDIQAPIDADVKAFQECECALCGKYWDAVRQQDHDAVDAAMEEIIKHCPAYKELTRDSNG